MEAELKAMKLGALSKRALASGATAAELEAAQDEDAPKAAVIALILRYEVDPTETLRGELSKLKLGALSRRAVAAGVDADALEVAQDGDAPKAAVTELIIRAELGPAIPEGIAERPGLGEPEPEPATREVHSASAAAEPTSVDVAGAADWTLTPFQPSQTSDFSPALCIFGSMRFPVPPEARLLFAALQAVGLYLKIVDMKAGQDIDKEVYEWIEHCHAFLVFGTKHYGEDTGNSACTYNEVKFAQAKRKNIILLRMIPWEDEFEELQARVLFNRNMLTLEWQPGQPMPTSLVGELLKAMDLPPTGVAGSSAALAHETEAANESRALAEAAKAHAQASAAAAKALAAQAQAEAEQALAVAAAEEDAARRAQEEAQAAKDLHRQAVQPKMGEHKYPSAATMVGAMAPALEPVEERPAAAAPAPEPAPAPTMVAATIHAPAAKAGGSRPPTGPPPNAVLQIANAGDVRVNGYYKECGEKNGRKRYRHTDEPLIEICEQ